MAEGTQIHSDAHPEIVDEIDRVYIDTVNAAAQAHAQLRGQTQSRYETFSLLFATLYYHTASMKEMAEDGSGKKIRAWLDNKDPSADSLMTGLELFTEYQKQLFKKGALELRRQ